MVAIRSTHGIEVPLSASGKLLVTSEVIFKVIVLDKRMIKTKFDLCSMLTMLLQKQTF